MQLIIQTARSEPSDATLRAMFEARKRVFVDLLKWDVPVLAGRYEVDQFDDPHATYVILTDRSGDHLASARLLETARPHILDSLFAGLCEGPVPRGPAIREITRFCIDPRPGASERRRLRNALVHALAAHAVATGIAHYTGVAERGWLKQILGFGWDCVPLGSTQRIGGETLGALLIAITPDTPALLAAGGLGPSPLGQDDARCAA